MALNLNAMDCKKMYSQKKENRFSNKCLRQTTWGSFSNMTPKFFDSPPMGR